MVPIADDVDTPAVLIDRDILDRNIARMSTAVAAKGIALRPHVKTHKMPEIAELQLQAGAAGLTVATVGEAEVFVDHGADDIFIAYPLWLSARQADLLRKLTARARIALGVDSADGAANAAAKLAGTAAAIDVLIEVDSGHHRSGVRTEQLLEVARATRDSGLRLTGVFTFPGHGYAPGKPGEAAELERRALDDAADTLIAAGFPIARRSGGSTPTAQLAATGGVTELRPGVYVFGDAQQLELGTCTPDEVALTVAATVVSRHETANGPRRIILDAGSKVLGSDRPDWATGFGRLIDHLDARIVALSEHHATVVWPDDAALPRLGARLRVIPNHVCLTTNLVDEVAVVRDAKLIDWWKVAARGKNN
ncbi:D-threo-3-hydroxyaspartate dehydratase [Mycobacterium basiliense]|uniref:D-threo-3-hydroxyaspartate dehydratase n=1 Tax=Mycobacterium basiliense TaxID=2094119 RepID=A0A3S4CEV1_9MYCO|nr:D-TA family PLP-dependent enzyme [Mycobacterium basiliense]VDM90718.1 D-threo-3-hydroxyaspartate dehydratase [Mycobacterium basiliense]